MTGKRGPYGGETLYRFDAATQRIVYHYFDSTGGYSEGAVEPADGELSFPEERYQEGAQYASCARPGVSTARIATRP